MRSYLSLRERLFNYQDPLILIRIMVTSVVKFSRKGYKIRFIFGQNSKKNIVFCAYIYVPPRRPVPSTDQALPSCFYFRIS